MYPTHGLTSAKTSPDIEIVVNVMPSTTQISHHLTTPRITPDQLLAFRRAQPQSPLVNKTIHQISHLTLLAGYLLDLPINLTATAIILLHRYLVLRCFPIHVDSQTELAVISATVLSLVTRSATIVDNSDSSLDEPTLGRKLHNIYQYLLSPTISPLAHVNPSSNSPNPIPTDPSQLPYPFTSPSTLHLSLLNHEPGLLKTLNYTLTTPTPHALALTYISTLSLPTTTLVKTLTISTLQNLNLALLSPQLLYLTHQPFALAVAAIYLAAKDEGIEVVGEDVEWWEVWDVEREELGFLVLSLVSMRVSSV